MRSQVAKLLLAGIIIARATATMFSKIGLNSMGPFNLLFVRFGLAFLLMCLIFWKRLLHTTRDDFFHGAIIGGAFFVVMSLEMLSLERTEVSTVSFLVNTAIVMVPLIQALRNRKWPAPKVMLCGVMALVGVALLTLRSSLSLTLGEGLALTEAFLYALTMILIDSFSHKGDPLVMGIFQVGFIGIFAGCASFLVETPQLPDSPTQWGVVLMLALVCTCFGFTLQPMAQKYVPVDEVAQFCALNPLAAAILSTIFLQERLGILGIGGGILILLGIMISSGVFSHWKEKRIGQDDQKELQEVSD